MTNLFIIHYVVLELILQLVSNMYSYCHGNMNQKDWSLSANCPQKIKTMILNQKL